MPKTVSVKALAVAACAVILSAGLSAAAIPSDGEMAFKVLRKDSDIGTHRIAFRREGEDLHVEIAIDLEVGFGPITLYEYTHRNREVWRDGRLMSLDSRTNDNGDEFTVSVRRSGDGLRVEATGIENYTAPADVLPTSYWHPDTVAQTRLLNTQTGELAEVEVEKEGEERIGVAGETRKAAKYRMSGDVELRLWYEPEGDPRGQLLKLAFTARGSEVDYKRMQPAGATETLQAFRNPQ